MSIGYHVTKTTRCYESIGLSGMALGGRRTRERGERQQEKFQQHRGTRAAPGEYSGAAALGIMADNEYPSLKASLVASHVFPRTG
jgi:hypothetical protein